MSAILPSGYGRNALEEVRKVVVRQPRTELVAQQFFPARNGVLTLVYEGFPRPVNDVKSTLAGVLPGLGPEEEGSKWPKTTLAAVRDDRVLGDADVQVLFRLCVEAGRRLIEHPVRVPVHGLDVVRYVCRSLEHDSIHVRLELDAHSFDRFVTESHRLEVRRVVDQATEPRANMYAPLVEGREHRCSHYRESAEGWSLIIPSPVGDTDSVRYFRRLVDHDLPGVFEWFSDTSLHVTVRSLNPLDWTAG
jgi:hypothetical protein